MQYELNKFFLPYLYGSSSIPEAIMKFGIDVDKFGSEELAARANTLLTYNDYIMDNTMINKLREAGYELAQRIRTDKRFKNLRFTITGRRKSLYGVDDKITDCQAKGNPISIGDILGIRLVVHNLEPQDHMDVFPELGMFIINFFKEIGFVPLLAQPLKDTNAFNPEKHPEIFVPTSSILQKEHKPFVKDYVSTPKENGYQSLQGVMVNPETNKCFEWQLRTMCMHVHAEVLAASHKVYKKEKIATRKIQENEYLVTEAVDYTRIRVESFMATGIKEEPFVDMAGLLESQLFLQCQRISSLFAEQ